MYAMSSTALLLCFASVAITASTITEIKGIKGHFIDLELPVLPETLKHLNIVWRREDGTAIAKNKHVGPGYEGKVTFNEHPHSIRLNNLSESDNGTYNAFNHTEWKDTLLVSIKLSVLERVSKPVINISPVDSSGPNCSFNVTCSSSKFWVYYKCEENKCSFIESSKEMSTSPSPHVNITITRSNGQVECNVSNPVSTDSISKELSNTCEVGKGELRDSHFQRDIALIISVICAAALLVLCGSLIWKKCRNSKAEGTATKHADVPTVIVTGSDGDEPGCVSIYSVVNKSAKCSLVQHSAQITSSSHQAQRLKSSEEKHKSQHQQKNRGKQRPLEDTAMTIYTTAAKPQENPTEDTDRTVYARATKPQEEECPLEDTARTIYDTTRPTTQKNEQLPPAVTNRTQTDTNQPDTVYYTLGHMTSGQQ